MGAHTTFEEFFKLLKQYQEEYGHCDVPSDYKVGTVNLGHIVMNIRCGRRKTTADQKAMLDSIGFVWKIREKMIPFEEVYQLLKQYQEEYGHCEVPGDYKVSTINLGQCVKRIRSGMKKTTAEEKAKLDTLGFVWKVREWAIPFEQIISLLEEYQAEHHHCDVPQNYKVGTINLGLHVKSIRSGRRKTTPEQKSKLDSIGFVWKKQNNT